MSDYDRYDFVLSMLTGAIMVGVLLVGGPLWALLPIGMVCSTISLYRHLDLPPRRGPNRAGTDGFASGRKTRPDEKSAPL